MEQPPIFLVGVPRSGTTLLRMMLDSHPEIMCGPEDPWMCADPAAPNLESLAGYLCQAPAGPVACYEGISSDEVHTGLARLIDDLLSAAARQQGKRRWAEKTPKNGVSLVFLQRLFPNARFVHIVRDGRDVALSTVACRWRHLEVASRKVRNTFANALRRWVSWVEQVERAPVDRISIRFEDLLEDPRPVMERVLAFCEAPWSDQVLQPYEFPHEVGPRQREGIDGFRRHTDLDPSRALAWRERLSWAQRLRARRIAEPTLRRLGYDPT